MELSDRWLFSILGVLCFTFALYVGWRVRPESRRVTLLVIGLCLIPILLRALLVFAPQIEYRLIAIGALSPESYALLRNFWATPFSIALFAMAAPRVRSRVAHGLLIGVSLWVWGFGADHLLATAVEDYGLLGGVVGRDGVCRQTSDYSCGPAAAVTLLHHHGVPSTEEEMARLCWSSSLRGTDELRLIRGLRLRLVGYRWTPVVSRATLPQLLSQGAPVAVTLSQRPGLDHWVVVLGVDGREVSIADPASGRGLLPLEELKQRWTGQMVWLRRD